MLKTIGKILLSCAIYALISHYVLDVDYEKDFSNSLLAPLIVFFVHAFLFLFYASIPLLVGFFIARGLKSNRKKPIDPYMNISLFVGWIIALLALFSGWSADNKSIANELLIDEMIMNTVKLVSEQTPIVLNSDTTLLSTNYKDRTVQSLYQLNFKEDATNKNKELMRNKIKLLVENSFCSDPSTIIFRTDAKQTLVNWKYVDLTGVVITNLSMKGADCGKK